MEYNGSVGDTITGDYEGEIYTAEMLLNGVSVTYDRVTQDGSRATISMTLTPL